MKLNYKSCIRTFDVNYVKIDQKFLVHFLNKGKSIAEGKNLIQPEGQVLGEGSGLVLLGMLTTDETPRLQTIPYCNRDNTPSPIY